MERVLLETGVGGVAALHDYYQEYVLKFEENMKKKVEAMLEKQRQLELNAYSFKYLIASKPAVVLQKRGVPSLSMFFEILG